MISGEAVVIVKKIHGFNYYWNEEKSKWEGLINNATLFNPEQAQVEFNKLRVEERIFSTIIKR